MGEEEEDTEMGEEVDIAVFDLPIWWMKLEIDLSVRQMIHRGNFQIALDFQCVYLQLYDGEKDQRAMSENG